MTIIITGALAGAVACSVAHGQFVTVVDSTVSAGFGQYMDVDWEDPGECGPSPMPVVQQGAVFLDLSDGPDATWEDLSWLSPGGGMQVCHANGCPFRAVSQLDMAHSFIGDDFRITFGLLVGAEIYPVPNPGDPPCMSDVVYQLGAEFEATYSSEFIVEEWVYANVFREEGVFSDGDPVATAEFVIQHDWPDSLGPVGGESHHMMLVAPGSYRTTMSVLIDTDTVAGNLVPVEVDSFVWESAGFVVDLQQVYSFSGFYSSLLCFAYEFGTGTDYTGDGLVNGDDLDRLIQAAIDSGEFVDADCDLIHDDCDDLIRIHGDATLDGVVDFEDLNLVLSNWDSLVTPDTSGDLNGNGVIEFDDLNAVLSAWGSTGC